MNYFHYYIGEKQTADDDVVFSVVSKCHTHTHTAAAGDYLNL
jgi:hypothetical protein